MFATLYVSPCDAGRACRAKSGSLPVEITDEWLAGLSPELRAALAPLVSTEVGGGTALSAGNPVEPTLAELSRCLAIKVADDQKALAERIASQAEKEARAIVAVREWLASDRPWVERDYSGRGLRRFRAAGCPYGAADDLPADHPLRAEVAAVMAAAEIEAKRQSAEFEATEKAMEEANVAAQAKAKAETEANEKRLAAAIAELVAKSGTASQRERLAAGRLPRAEALDLVRSVVFVELEKAPRYVRLTARDVGATCGGELEFSARDLTECPAYAWETLTAIGTAAPEGATVQLRSHVGSCSCDGDTTGDECSEVERLSVLVTLDWHGAQLSREYAVPEP